MPSLLHPAFPPLIRALPVLDHSVVVEAGFWESKFAAAGQAALWAAIFGGRPSVAISRRRLHGFSYSSAEQKTAEILLWGYPTNMRGIVERLLPSLSVVSGAAASAMPWSAYCESFPAGTGISTITKLAHFHGRSFGGLPALILDGRIIKRTPRWTEVAVPGLSYNTAERRYPDYLRVMHAAAALGGLACTAEQLEFFLFTLGTAF